MIQLMKHGASSSFYITVIYHVLNVCFMNNINTASARKSTNLHAEEMMLAVRVLGS